MRLVYFKGNNFGDELSPYIFNKLLPNLFDNDDSHEFFGIGSIIGTNNFKSASKKIIFSSGYGGYMGPPPKINNDCMIYCVRGPLTAKILNIDDSLSITDGAALLRAIEFSPIEKKYDFSYIPHWRSDLKYEWKQICDNTDIHYISPRNNVDFIINEIRSSNIIISEAMHGAIVADTFRIPWIPIRTFKKKYEFKWLDWTNSLSITYEPVCIHSLIDNDDFVLKKNFSKASVFTINF